MLRKILCALGLHKWEDEPPAHKTKHQPKLGFILCAGRDSVTDKFFGAQKIFLDPASRPDFVKSGLRFASCAPAFESLCCAYAQ